MHATVFVEIAVGQDQQKALTNRRLLPALRAIEGRRTERAELLLRLCGWSHRPTG